MKQNKCVIYLLIHEKMKSKIVQRDKLLETNLYLSWLLHDLCFMTEPSYLGKVRVLYRPIFETYFKVKHLLVNFCWLLYRFDTYYYFWLESLHKQIPLLTVTLLKADCRLWDFHTTSSTTQLCRHASTCHNQTG